MNENQESIVFTNRARCRDCWRCVRVCPVKAIRVRDGQAEVVADRCVACGSCIRQCPQHAKAYRFETEKVKSLLATRKNVALSLAPSFAAFFSPSDYKKIPAALRRLGFSFIAETAIGAWHSASASREYVLRHPGTLCIGTACPAVVRYVERYHEDRVPHLIQVPSPMVMHARLCKERLGADSAFVFAGPCVAKKFEASREECRSLVDAVLTFEELTEWFVEASIDLAAIEDGYFDELSFGAARFFPLAGGMLKTASFPTDLLSSHHLAVSGFESVKDTLLTSAEDELVVEPLFCAEGCINGPAGASTASLTERRRNLIRYSEQEPGKAVLVSVANRGDPSACGRTASRGVLLAGQEVDDHEVQVVLQATGHGEVSEQLNCGACGYESCVDRATAVVLGLAERDMCIPFMRRLAEQRSDRIMETSPNGIVILDSHLQILHMNPAFQDYFRCFNSSAGRTVSFLMDPDPFERLAAGESDLIEMTVHHQRFKLVCHQICYALREEQQYVGLFVNITGQWNSEQRQADLRQQTMAQIRELFAHQLQVADQLAGYLGESTVRSEVLLERLLELVHDDGAEETDRTVEGSRLWNIFTSK